MKIVISPDSFKGSLTSEQAGKAMASACKDVFPDVEIDLKPMADGGEGTLDALVFSTEGKRLQGKVSGPLGDLVDATYGELGNRRTAVIEVAEVAGLTQVPLEQRNPYHTSSYGLGEMMLKVLDEGYESILIGLGGSATNDGGLGMLQALGAEFLDASGKPVHRFGKNLFEVDHVDFSNLDPRLKRIDLQVASDVDNPLCGPRGATHVYGPQKGASPEQVEKLDQALDHFATLIEKEAKQNLKQVPGAGAAGGLGFALMIVGAKLVSGAKLVAEAIQLDDAISSSDLVLTGEGQSDEQTLFGKAPGYAAKVAKKHNIPTVLISGSLSGDLNALRAQFSGCFSITQGAASLDECMNKGEHLLYEQTKNVLHLIKSINH